MSSRRKWEFEARFPPVLSQHFNHPTPFLLSPCQYFSSPSLFFSPLRFSGACWPMGRKHLAYLQEERSGKYYFQGNTLHMTLILCKQFHSRGAVLAHQYHIRKDTRLQPFLLLTSGSQCGVYQMKETATIWIPICRLTVQS